MRNAVQIVVMLGYLLPLLTLGLRSCRAVPAARPVRVAVRHR